MKQLFVDQIQIAKAINDIADALRAWRLWTLFGFNDVKLRYRRSVLGPLWASLSMAIQILVTAFVMSFLFKTSLQRYLPYLCIGLILWGMLTATVNEGAQAFVASADLILQVKRPLFIYVFQVIWRNVIIGAHTSIIFFIVAFSFKIFPGLTYVLVIPGLILFVANSAWIAAMAAILSTRFRDIPMIVTNAFTALFWLTPVLYEAEQMNGWMRRVIILNPLSHILEVLRAPLLLETPTLANWVVSILTALIGSLLTVLLFARTRSRIAYWL
jgi:ABC-type polysaccharide/polyol phosphate export permease